MEHGSNLPIVLTLFLVYSSLCHSFELKNAAFNQSRAAARLELAMGLSITLAGVFEASHNRLRPNILITTIRALGNEAYFYPILSSPSFNSTNASQSLGFSLGFLAMSDMHFYLAVCAGISGQPQGYLSQKTFGNFMMLDGYVTPVWLANPNEPLTCLKFSLKVVTVGGSNHLQLQGRGHTIIWSVANAGMIEVQDTGDLLIYDSQNMCNIIWRSSTQQTSTLFQEQRLRVGMELTSNDSAYMARMERGGLIFYLNTAQFAEHASRNWVFPIMCRNGLSSKTLKDLFSSPPCPTSHNSAYITLAKSPAELFFETGSCQSKVVNNIQFATPFSIDWGFLRLENDGKLYAYAVIRNLTDNGFFTKSFAIDCPAYSYRKRYSNLIDDDDMSDRQYFSWRNECNVPMRCGCLGVCRPDASDACTCPPYFDQVNALDSSKGCKRATSLPPCKRGDEHINTTCFLRLDNMTTIGLFNGWPFTSSANVDACKQMCTQICSCDGFVYEVDKDNCFFITDEMSLLNVTGKVFISVPGRSSIRAGNYITYLKVASTTNITSSSDAEKTDQRSQGVSVAATTPLKSSGTRKMLIILLTTSVPSLVIAVLGIGLCLINARKCKCNGNKKQAEDNEKELRDILPLLPGRFSYKDLHEATDGFKKQLGVGASGSVYAGVLSDGRKVAVKILASPLESQAKQFLAEITSMGHTNHVNIVSLIGFCCELPHRLLVYEYVEKGSLDKWLFLKNEFPDNGNIQTSTASISDSSLDWQTRYNVALGIARGLNYLHEDCTQPVLHFDIKPQNILLDCAFTAKLGDFGMSRLMKRGSSQVESIEVKGTPGYIAPEFLSHGIVGKKCDVYSMGMVMLEIVRGRRNAELTLSKSALDSKQPEVWHFSNWVTKNCKEGLMMQLLDERLKMSASNMEQMQRLIYTALWCIQENPELRPSAHEVVQWLEGRCPVKPLPFVTQNADASVYRLKCRTT